MYRFTFIALLLALAQSPRATTPPSIQSLLSSHCLTCHDTDTKKGDLDLSTFTDIPTHPLLWEKVLQKIRTRQMPPPGKDRPTEAVYAQAQSDLESSLDTYAAAHPHPGRTSTLRRLTRTEYQNAIRDLLSLDIDAAALLPADESAHGFDNVTTADLSPTLLDRYVTAAEKIARLAVGTPQRAPGGDTFRLKPDLTQEQHVEGLPLGTRGGALIHCTFPRSGEYEVTVRLTRDRNEHVEGLKEPHDLVILLDRAPLQTFTVKPSPGNKDEAHVDAHLKLRFTAAAGPRDLGVTFLKSPSDLIETAREPYLAHFNLHRHPRQSPAVYQISITGPFTDTGPGDTPSRHRIFTTYPAKPTDETAAATQVLRQLLHRAYRRPVGDADVARILPFYHDARKNSDFDAGIESALSAILVSREFLFRVELDPPNLSPHTAHRITDLELASRLSFFLWSSIPDDDLLAAAERGDLRIPSVLSAQTRRMLADPRSRSLVTSFADQWLHLRNLDSITPDARLFPDFDDNLRQSLRRETESLLDDVIHHDRSILSLLKTDHTWLDERLAKHYGLPDIYGSRWREIPLPPDSDRGGLLRQGSILTVTSYATRTSPVLRGKWILDNLLGTPPPPPPPNVPALVENTINESLPIRQRLEQHRANPACAACHAMIDPAGFSLENFDAIGRFRTLDDGHPVDAAGGLPSGESFTGPTDLEAALLRRPDLFTSTLTEKLLTFALGRGIDIDDAPAVRQIVRRAKVNDYRFSSLIEAIVTSVPFQMRSTD